MNYTIYVNPKGQLIRESNAFFKICRPIDGVTATELWCDAFELNKSRPAEILISALDCDLDITHHNEFEFSVNGGGFRLDLI